MYLQLNWSAIISKGGHYKKDEAIKYLNLSYEASKNSKKKICKKEIL